MICSVDRMADKRAAPDWVSSSACGSGLDWPIEAKRWHCHRVGWQLLELDFDWANSMVDASCHLDPLADQVVPPVWTPDSDSDYAPVLAMESLKDSVIVCVVGGAVPDNTLKKDHHGSTDRMESDHGVGPVLVIATKMPVTEASRTTV